MIKVANNLQTMLAKIASATSSDDILYSPGLGGFHVRGQYPQSMIPEAYQQVQARNMFNPGVGDEPEYFQNPAEYAMALNTAFPEQVLQEANRRFPNSRHKIAPGGEDGQLALRAEKVNYGEPFNSKEWNFAGMPDKGKGIQNPFSVANMFRFRDGRKGHSFISPRFQNAAYDIAPENPMGNSAKNPQSAQQIVDIANQMYNAQPRR